MDKIATKAALEALAQAVNEKIENSCGGGGGSLFIEVTIQGLNFIRGRSFESESMSEADFVENTGISIEKFNEALSGTKLGFIDDNGNTYIIDTIYKSGNLSTVSFRMVAEMVDPSYAEYTIENNNGTYNAYNENYE